MNEEIIDLINTISNTNSKKCMLCGKCSARCPNFDAMDIKPHQFVNMVNKERFSELLSCKTLYKCLTCLECVERCPRNVAPAYLINAIKEIAVRKSPTISANDIPPLLDDDMPQQLLVSAFRKFS